MAKEYKEEDIQKQILTLKSLVTQKNATEADLREVAIRKLKNRDVEEEFSDLFGNRVETRLARDLQNKYLEDYSIESISDRNTLREIIYLEVIQRRLQEKLNEYYEKNEKALPLQLIDTIHKNQTAVLELKESLGLNKAKTQKGTYDALDHLKRRFKHWMTENRGSRTLICPYCSKMILLKIRTAAWEAIRHPFFKDKILMNEHLVSLFIQGKLTREDVASVLGTSPDYTDWLVEKIWPSTDTYKKLQKDLKHEKKKQIPANSETENVSEQGRNGPIDKHTGQTSEAA